MREKWRSLSRNQTLLFLLAVFGFVVTVGGFAAPKLVQLLPGPKVLVLIQGVRSTAANTVGCVYYTVTIVTPPDEVIEQLYLTVQFPGDIASHKFGAHRRADFSEGRRIGIGVFGLGKNADGECEVIQAAFAPSLDLTATIAGPGMVQMRGVRILPKTTAQGIFALSLKKPSFSPTAMFKEGTYEYTRFGLTVSKPLEFVDQGVNDL